MRRTIGTVAPGQLVREPHDLYVDGDVAGRVEAKRAIVTGDVLPGAGILARGGGAQIIIAGDVFEGAVLIADGGGAEVIVMGRVRR